MSRWLGTEGAGILPAMVYAEGGRLFSPAPAGVLSLCEGEGECAGAVRETER